MSENEAALEQPAPGISRLRFKRIEVGSEAEGRAMVANYRNYLTDLFRQSQEPYFGTNRWSDECLQRNKVGLIEEARDAIWVRARITTDRAMKSGVCDSASTDAFNLLAYCKSAGVFYEIVATGERADQIQLRCPDRLTY